MFIRCALNAVIAFLKEKGKPKWVRWVLFDEFTYASYREVLKDLLGDVDGIQES
ncbi:MAG: hypothetical protein V3R94_08095 [Acidobacteriota bacterium]